MWCNHQRNDALGRTSLSPFSGEIGRAGAAGAWYCKEGKPLLADALNSVVPLLARPMPLASECASNVATEDTFYRTTNDTL
jgi:hypothetical protein